MKTAMYLRKSRAEENESVEVTLSRHKTTLTDFAQKNDLHIMQVYEEVVSGDSLFARPAMLKMLQDIENDDFEAVLCMDIDRLGRGNMKEQGIILETLKAAAVLIITPRKIYDLNNELDETYSEFQAFMARQELKLIKGRMQRGIMKSAMEGCHVGTPPYGYLREWKDKKSTLKPDPECAQIVKMIFDLFLSGKGTHAIVSELQQMGVPAPRGDRWSTISVARMLRNDVYRGKIVRNRIKTSKDKNGVKHFKTFPRDQWMIVDGLHDPIISDKVFMKAQEILRENYRPPVSNSNTIKNPFAGLLRCRICGRALERRPYKYIGHEYIICTTKGCCRQSNMEYVSEAVIALLYDKLEEVQVEAKQLSRMKKNDTSLQIISGMKSELEKLNVQMDKQHDLLEQGIYTIDTFQKRREEIKERITSLKENLAYKEDELSSAKEKAEIVIPKIKHVLQNYSFGTPAQKNKLLKSVLSEISYYKSSTASPHDFTIELILRDNF